MYYLVSLPKSIKHIVVELTSRSDHLLTLLLGSTSSLPKAESFSGNPPSMTEVGRSRTQGEVKLENLFLNQKSTIVAYS
jgi:hypothetical protein